MPDEVKTPQPQQAPGPYVKKPKNNIPEMLAKAKIPMFGPRPSLQQKT
jgi:hypothetical protein